MTCHAGEVTRRVLVVDDDPTVATVFVRVLNRRGYDTTAVDRLDAVGDLPRPDLALIDAGCVPEDCTRLPFQAPVILMSGMDATDLNDLAQKLGAHGVLSKPSSVRNILQAVELLLDR